MINIPNEFPVFAHYLPMHRWEQKTGNQAINC